MMKQHSARGHDPLPHMMQQIDTRNWTPDCALMPSEAERQRLGHLYQLGILDTPKEQMFQDFVEQALKMVPGTSIAAIGLVDADRQWFKAIVGSTLEQTCRSVSFCSHTIQTKGVLLVRDASKDPRFANNRFVTGQAGIRFYAGVKLTRGVGTLCVLGTEPRDLSLPELRRLRQLAQFVDIQLLTRALITGYGREIMLN